MSQAQSTPQASSLNLGDPDAFTRKRLLYIAMPYSAPTKQGIADNIEAARSFVRDYMPRDPHVLPVLPHNMGLGIECIGDDQYWYDATASLAYTPRCAPTQARRSSHRIEAADDGLCCAAYVV